MSANTIRPKKESKEPSVGMSNFTLSFTEEDEELPPQLPGGLLKKAKPSGDDVRFFLGQKCLSTCSFDLYLLMPFLPFLY